MKGIVMHDSEYVFQLYEYLVGGENVSCQSLAKCRPPLISFLYKS